ncbi:hypothetical protein WBJ53_16910 [Spirosoma sp. SC4-14]|uniref:hypothetical protein n=1 Tax=Spirosoma sp. SC4-14 TaxID=3128900 RepID=UPI0030D5514E
MTDETSPSPSSLTPDEQTKLRELTNQSWNLELAISGVAMFAILQWPDALDSAFSYIQYNFLSGREDFVGRIPAMAYSMFKAATYVLFAAFLANFIMRAFWIGLVGLQAVFPAGIQYDRLPMSTGYTQKRLAEELGPIDRYILWLDKRSNVLFALAFQVAIIMFTVAIMYILALGLYVFIQPNVPGPVWLILNTVINVFFFGGSLLLPILSLERFRDNPKASLLHYRLTKIFQNVYMGVYRPMSYITNTFLSNIPRKKLTRTYLVFYGLFMVIFMIEFTHDQLQGQNRTSFLNRRHLFTARVDSLYINPANYDNQRPADSYVDAASIQADIIREPYLKLFIAYPKALDTLLTKMAKEPEWPDSLSRPARRQQYAVWSSQQVNKLVQITVNDSVMAQPGLFFTQAGPLEQKGWQTVLVPGNLRIGYNLLRIGINRPKHQEPEELVSIPFWYVPEKLSQPTSVLGRADSPPAATSETNAQSRKFLRKMLHGNASRGEGGN